MEKAREEAAEARRDVRERERQERRVMRQKWRGQCKIHCSLEWNQCMLRVKSVNKFQKQGPEGY